MSINPKGITAACMLSVIACSALAVPTYDVSCLDCSRDTPLMPLGINLSGVVVASDGCVNPDANYPPHAPPLDCFDGQGYVIDHGTITTTPVFPGTPNSQAMAINDSNVVAGMASHPKIRNVLAYAWDGQDTVKLGDPLVHPGYEEFSRAFGINDRNLIVGFAEINRFTFTPFLYKNGVMTAVPQPPNSIGEYGHWTVRINERDHVAGTTVFPDDTIHAWLTRNGLATDLNPEAIGSEVTAMNDADAVVGWTRYAINTPYIAALWRNGKTTLLNELPGFLGQANSINNRGWVVGDVCDVTCIAFVFNGTKMFDLNTLLNESSAGWTLSQATGINDAGVIVGAGFFKGVFHAFMATPEKHSGDR